MKRLKALGLAAVAAMALTAFLGAGSASATVLCTTTTTPCDSHIDQIEFSAKSATSGKEYSTGGTEEATCTGSSFSGNKTVTGSSTTTEIF
jgi:hypothetical protein